MSSNKILILEDKVQRRIPGYDHVFSFGYNPIADSFTHHYLSETELDRIYDEEFKATIQFLDNDSLKTIFSYRGVYLLWCFKKALFEFSYFIKHRYETFKQVLNHFSTSDFYLSNADEIFEFPSLYTILKNSKLNGNPHVHFSTFDHSSHPEERSTKSTFLNLIWPSVIQFGDFKNAETAIFSDYEKSKNVLSKISALKPVLLTNSKAPRTLLRAVQNKSSLFQFVSNGTQSYSDRTQCLIKQIKELKLFEHFELGELDGQDLLQNELEHLFRTFLPKLFFEIDQMHRFFQNASKLRNILIDEDVSITKNAFCQIAKQYNVKSYLECHGALGHQIGLIPLTADIIFMWGRAQKDKLAQWGCPEEKIVVTGCTKYAPYQSLNDDKVRLEICKQLNLDPNKKIILIGFNSTRINRGQFVLEAKVKQNADSILSAVHSILDEHPDYQAILKVHPGDDHIESYQQWGKLSPNANKRVIEIFDSLLLAKASDLLVVYASTYAVDGFALDRPVICFDDDSWKLLSEFKKYSIFSYTNRADELKSLIPNLLSNNDWRSKFWQDARKNCLNENGKQAADIITDYMTEPHTLPSELAYERSK